MASIPGAPLGFPGPGFPILPVPYPPLPVPPPVEPADDPPDVPVLVVENCGAGIPEVTPVLPVPEGLPCAPPPDEDVP